MAFRLEAPTEQIIECEMPLSLKVLSHAVSFSILNKINAGDIRGALDELHVIKLRKMTLLM